MKKRRRDMMIKGYFDGNAVRTVEPVKLKMNQIVYISVPKNQFSSEEEQRISAQLAALDDVCGMLSADEAEIVDKSIQKGITFKGAVL